MNAERDYFGKLYSNKAEWGNYTRRELNAMKETFEGLMDAIKTPLSDERLAKTYRISVEDISYLREHSEDVKHQLHTYPGVKDPREFNRIKNTLMEHIDDILIARQDGDDPKGICAYYGVPYDRRAWVAMATKEKRSMGLDVDSKRDVHYVADAYEDGKKVDDLFIRRTGLFRDRLDLYDALERNDYDLKEYLGKEAYNDYLRSEGRPVKEDSEKLTVA